MRYMKECPECTRLVLEESAASVEFEKAHNAVNAQPRIDPSRMRAAERAKYNELFAAQMEAEKKRVNVRLRLRNHRAQHTS